MPPPRIELRLSVYNTDILPLYYRGSEDIQNIHEFGDIDKSIIGCSVVIHDGIDDYGLDNDQESKITGNAGGRLDCAIIGKMKSI